MRDLQSPLFTVRRQHNIVVCHLTEYFDFVAVLQLCASLSLWIYIAYDGVSPALCLVRLFCYYYREFLAISSWVSGLWVVRPGG